MPLHGTVTGSHVLVSSDLSGHFALTVDNDQSTQGHGLKVTTDGATSATNVFDVEIGSTTHFRVRGDGRIGIGKSSALPTAKVTIDGSSVGGDNADLSIAGKIMHLADSNTHITFPENDSIQLTGGGVSLFEGSVGGEGASVFILSGADGNAALPDPGEFGDVALFVSGAIGSRAGSGGGTAVFGGDMCLSGTLHILSGSGRNADPAVSIVALGGRPVVGSPLTQLSSATAINTLPAAAIVNSNGILRLGANSSPVSDVLPTASSIIALLPNVAFGLQIDFGFFNASGQDVTIGGQSSIVNLNLSQASFVIPATKGRMFRFAVNSNLTSLVLIPISDNFSLTS